ncbi:MAG: DUF1275 domain-containing protein [Actinomycetota bacterium]|nr:DUF1275 domain-containing protein [Actinomycetota bacterium]
MRSRGGLHRIRAALAGDEYARRMRAGWSPPSDPPRPTLPLVLLVLTLTTGLVDAVSYLGLQHAFTALQTGNVVTLGFALAGVEGFPKAPPAISLIAFTVGAGAGGRLAFRLIHRHRRWFALSLGIEAMLVALAAVTVSSAMPDIGFDPRLLAVVLLAAAMGLRSATVRLLPTPDASTTVVTSTLTGLAADSAALRGGVVQPAWRMVLITARVAGAAVGALMVQVSLSLPLLLMAGLTALVAVGYALPALRRSRRARRGLSP